MTKTIEINGRKIGYGIKPYIIAEISANHNGSLDRALLTIKKAKESGADAVKIQSYTADTITIDSDKPDFFINHGPWKGKKLYDLYKSAETPFEWHSKIFQYANEIGVTLFSTPFDEKAVDILDELGAPAFKIASFEIVDSQLLRYVAKKNKPVILSTGMASQIEIAEALKIVRNSGCNDIILMHCISSYPAPINEASLKMIQILSNDFGVNVGLSDHTLGNTAALVAVSLGACAIEKHFTIDRNDGGPDSAFSIEPADLKLLCKSANEAWLSLGDNNFKRSASELDNKVFRRSLYFVKDLPAGTVLDNENVKSIRPGLGMHPRFLNKIIGSRTKYAVLRGDRVTFDALCINKDDQE